MANPQITDKSVILQQINELYTNKPEPAVQFMLNAVGVLEQNKSQALGELYAALDLDSFIKVIRILGGKTVTFDTIEKIQENLTFAYCYHLKENENKTWDEIRSILPFKISSIHYGKMISKFKGILTQRVKSMLSSKFGEK